MTKERLEQIYTEYIGNGQFGIDFEKKHIMEAMKVFAREACTEFYAWVYDEKLPSNDTVETVSNFFDEQMPGD